MVLIIGKFKHVRNWNNFTGNNVPGRARITGLSQGTGFLLGERSRLENGDYLAG
jgi:hypothetical protein